MGSSRLWRLDGEGRKKTLISIMSLAVIAGCLLLTDTLLNDHAKLSEADRLAQNTSASELYLTLATLAQPTTTSDITHALLGVIRKDARIKGATLFDVEGQLVAQLGAGNDTLQQHPTTPTARIPIRSTANKLYGHAVVAFKPHQDNGNSAFHYIALTIICAILAIVIIGLLKIHRLLPYAIVSWAFTRY